MKKSVSFIPILLLFTLFLTLIVFHTNATPMLESSLPDIQVDEVYHTIDIRYSGFVAINDIITVSARPGETTRLQSFPMGFPYMYGSNVSFCYAYNSANQSEQFPVILDAGLGKIGYYGVMVTFPGEGILLNDMEPYRFTTVFVLSNVLLLKNETIVDIESQEEFETTLYTIEFPAYPSIPYRASVCVAAIAYPPYMEDSDQVVYYTGTITEWTGTWTGVQKLMTSTVQDLPEFTYATATCSFYIRKSETTGEERLTVVSIDDLQREIKINEQGEVSVVDSYRITSTSPNSIDWIYLYFPTNASNIAVTDELMAGSPFKPSQIDIETRRYRVSFKSALRAGETRRFKVTYDLPRECCLTQHDSIFDFNITFSENVDWLLKKFSIVVTLPEGAEMSEFKSSLETYHIEKGMIQNTLTFASYNAPPAQPVTINFTYKYSIFWTSFSPTLWMGAIVAIGCAIALLSRASKPTIQVSIPKIRIQPENIRKFVDAYEEKTKIVSDLKLMEVQAQKGKIPRRHYRVRKQTLEGRLALLSKDLAELREKIRTVGSRYADVMRQLEVAETELEGIEIDIRRVEARYKRGEISLEAYRRLFNEYRRREDRAKTTIDGVLIRLREEAR